MPKSSKDSISNLGRSYNWIWTESEVLNALKNMRNNKSPGNDGLTEKLYET